MKFSNRTSSWSLLAAGAMVLGLAAQDDALARGSSDGEVATDDTEPVGPAVALAFPGIPGPKGKKGAEKETKAAAPAAAPKPNPELRNSLLECIDGVVPGDVQTGVMRDYDFKDGMKVDQRTGFMDRKPATLTNTCFLGELQPRECLAFTVNQEAYEALGNSNDWEIQCVYSDEMSAGVIGNKSEYPYKVDDMSGNSMMLMCGHSEGDGYDCAEGSNSARSGLWQEKLKADGGKQQLGFCVSDYAKQEVSYDAAKYPGGRWVYCQYYNTPSKKSMFGYEFLQKTH